MKLYKFDVPYSQDQLITVRGYIWAEIEADSEEEAVAIFKNRYDEGYVNEPGIYFELNEHDLEVNENHGIVIDMDDVTCDSED